jgi:hypothetical protein
MQFGKFDVTRTKRQLTKLAMQVGYKLIKKEVQHTKESDGYFLFPFFQQIHDTKLTMN